MTPAVPEPAPTAVAPGAPTRSNRHRTFLIALAAFAAGALGVAAFWPRPDAATVWQEARLAFEARDFPRAEERMRLLATLREPKAEDWMLRAQVALGFGRDGEALEALKRVPDDYALAASARLEEGQVELRRDRYVAAERAFRRAIDRDPKSIQAWRELIYILGVQLRRQELDDAFRHLAALSPLNDSEVFLWCLSRGVTWDGVELVGMLAKAIAADPDDRWSRIGQADALLGLGRLDEAEAALASLPAADADARAVRVRIALARGDDQGAESLLDEGPEDNLGLALLRGQFALARNDKAAALRHYRIAAAKAPNQREAVSGLGKALQINGDPAAAPQLERARKLDALGTVMQKASTPANRRDPELIRALGAACAAADRLPEARAWYNIAVTANPLDVKAQQALARLDAQAAAPGPASPAR